MIHGVVQTLITGTGGIGKIGILGDLHRMHAHLRGPDIQIFPVGLPAEKKGGNNEDKQHQTQGHSPGGTPFLKPGASACRPGQTADQQKVKQKQRRQKGNDFKSNGQRQDHAPRGDFQRGAVLHHQTKAEEQ